MCIHPCMAWWFYPSHAFMEGSPFNISTDLRASSMSHTHYFPIQPPFLVYTLTYETQPRRTPNMAVHKYSLSLVSWTWHVCERTNWDDGMFPNTALLVGTQIYGFDYMDAFTPHLRFLPTIMASFGTKSLLLWKSEHRDTKREMIIWLDIKQQKASKAII